MAIRYLKQEEVESLAPQKIDNLVEALNVVASELQSVANEIVEEVSQESDDVQEDESDASAEDESDDSVEAKVTQSPAQLNNFKKTGKKGKRWN